MELARDGYLGLRVSPFGEPQRLRCLAYASDRQSSPDPARGFRRFGLWKYGFFVASADGVDAQVA